LLLIFLFIFLFLTGVSSSILRATLFWLLIMVGRIFGRIINYTNVLLVVLLIFFVLNPKIILFDIGFHLSFLSILALIYFLPIVNKFIKFKNKKFDFFIKIFNATLAITIVLAPYLVFYFSEFNILSLIFNVFLIPFSGLILSLVFVSVVVSFGWMFLAKALGFISFLMINVFMVCLNLFNNINIHVQGLFFNSVFLIIGYYWLLIILIIDFYINNKDLTLTL
jgi:competence protein ComEC